MQGESDEHANSEEKLEVRQSGDERTSIFDVLPLVAVPSSDEDERCEAMMQEKTLVSVVMQLSDLLYDENINDDTFEVDHETFRRFHLELRGTIHSQNSVLFSKMLLYCPSFSSRIDYQIVIRAAIPPSHPQQETLEIWPES